MADPAALAAAAAAAAANMGMADPVMDAQKMAVVEMVLKQLSDMGATVFFEKPLTSSDMSGSGRVVIPKAIAEQYFPRLEQANGLPVRAVDTRGREYTFKFRFWINNQSRMYLLECAGELHRAYTMQVGDVMVFAQKPDGSLVVAGRPATKNDVIKKAPVKRPAGDRPPGAKREKKPRQPGQPGAEGRRKKRGPNYRELMEMEAVVDGIFRVVPPGVVEGGQQPVGVSMGKNGRWVVTLNLAGEHYQALFESQEDALEAFNASGAAVGVDDSHKMENGDGF